MKTGRRKRQRLKVNFAPQKDDTKSHANADSPRKRLSLPLPRKHQEMSSKTRNVQATNSVALKNDTTTVSQDSSCLKALSINVKASPSLSKSKTCNSSMPENKVDNIVIPSQTFTVKPKQSPIKPITEIHKSTTDSNFIKNIQQPYSTTSSPIRKAQSAPDMSSLNVESAKKALFSAGQGQGFDVEKPSPAKKNVSLPKVTLDSMSKVTGCLLLELTSVKSFLYFVHLILCFSWVGQSTI